MMLANVLQVVPGLVCSVLVSDLIVPYNLGRPLIAHSSPYDL